jgi:hypothetical protein
MNAEPETTLIRPAAECACAKAGDAAARETTNNARMPADRRRQVMEPPEPGAHRVRVRAALKSDTGLRN